MIESAAEKEKTLKAKVSTIGNIVHASVPVSDNEVTIRSIVYRIVYVNTFAG